jgi:Flp pilus assembly protein TadB
MASPADALPPGAQDDLATHRPQLPPSGGRIDRISQHSRSLFDELTHWADLKIKLVRVDLEEKVEEKKIQIGLGVGMALVGFFGLLFLLTTIALALGWWLGHPTWGFLIVTVVLFAIVLGLKMAMPRMVKKIEKRVPVESDHLSYRIQVPEASDRSRKTDK